MNILTKVLQSSHKYKTISWATFLIQKMWNKWSAGEAERWTWAGGRRRQTLRNLFKALNLFKRNLFKISPKEISSKSIQKKSLQSPLNLPEIDCSPSLAPRMSCIRVCLNFHCMIFLLWTSYYEVTRDCNASGQPDALGGLDASFVMYHQLGQMSQIQFKIFAFFY